jgi:hypothetical protein
MIKDPLAGKSGQKVAAKGEIAMERSRERQK